MNTSIRFNTPENDVDTTLSIHGRTTPVQWELSPPLSTLEDDWKVIEDADYLWLKEQYQLSHYPWYFMDGIPGEGKPAFELEFIRGNMCRESG